MDMSHKTVQNRDHYGGIEREFAVVLVVVLI